MKEPAAGLPALGIRRPLLVLVINLLIAIAGLGALLGVEVRELPDVDRPIVSVRAELPGASPETVDSEVTRVLEGAVARVSGIESIQSSSEENNARVRAEFSPDIDLNVAAADVREAVSRARRELPDDVEEVTVVKAEQDAEPILNIAAISDTLDADELTRIIETDIVPALIAVEGVADVPLFGERQRVLHVVLDPARLARFGLSVTDVAAVLQNAPFDVPAGSFSSDDQELIVRADASVVTAAQVEDIVVRGTTQVGDVAQVFFGPEDANSLVRLNGRPVIGLGVVRQASANTIQISEAVTETIADLNARFENVELVKTTDNAVFIRGAVHEVLLTLGIAIVIVVAALWLFTGSLRATLVPCVAIPVALIGTIAAIWLLGFSINILTLLAIVLATGLVVDDAIVVLENIQRRRAQGLGARAAAVLGTQQVFFAVVATTAVLIAVFVPIAFLPSTAGRLFREFGLVLAVAVGISSFVALSLVPTLAARLPANRPPGAFYRGITNLGQWLADAYANSLRGVLAHPLVTIAMAVAIAGACAGVYQLLDQELLPPEDRGILYVNATGPDGVSLNYTERQADRLENILRPLVASGTGEYLYTIVGRYDLNRARVTVPLEPWEERSRSQQEIAAALADEFARVPGSRISVSNPNSLDLRDADGGLEVALIGSDYGRLYDVAREMADAMEREVAALYDTRISYQPTQPELSLVVDRRRAADLGVPLDGLAATLRAMVDGDEITDLNVDDQAVPIMLESSAGTINDPTDLVNLYVETEAGALLPLSSVVTIRESGVAAELDRHAQRRAIEIDANVVPGVPLQAAVADVRELADRMLPPDVDLLLLGEAAELAETSRDVSVTYAVALLVVFLVLCAQFESITSAAVVTIIVPFGIAAAILALYLSGISVNIYSQIGLVMLIGLMAKNSILLVEFADQMRDRGQSVSEAIATSARVRLRPVVMTLLSTMLGGLPLILSTGPGAEARSAIGWVIFGGLGLATGFTLFLTPAVYRLLAPLSPPRASEADRLAGELEQAGAERV